MTAADFDAIAALFRIAFLLAGFGLSLRAMSLWGKGDPRAGTYAAFATLALVWHGV